MRIFNKYWIGGVGMLVLVAVIVLATGGGSAVASSISSVFVTNDASHAVPVRDQNTDGNGNVKVAEQARTQLLASGTLDSTNSALPEINASGYRTIRVSVGFVACDPNGNNDQSALIVSAKESGAEYSLGPLLRLCQGGLIDGAPQLVYEVPGRTVSIRCSCSGNTGLSVAVFGRSN